MMERTITCLVLIAGLQACTAAPSLDVQYYDVQGTTRQALRRSLAERGPIGDDGVRYHAYTRWFVRWNYRLASSAGGCRVDSLEVSLEATMILPRWSGSKDAPASLRRQWERYVAALRLHEEGHYAHGVAVGDEVRRRLAALGGTENCGRLRQRVDAEGEAVLEAYRKREREYDLHTGHGVTQGARI